MEGDKILFLYNLLYYVFGYVKIELQGSGTEKFINLAVKRGILFWDIHRKVDSVQLKTQKKNLYKLRDIAERTDCEVKILSKKGIPFYLEKTNQRKGLVIGIIFFVISLYYLSTFVWFIEVDGNEKVSNEEILVISEKYGLKPGIKKETLDPTRTAQLITSENDQLVWANVEFTGVKALVEVVERKEKEKSFYGHGNIVALEKGEVEKVVALSGFSLVEKSSKVSKNDVLIAGRIVPTEYEDSVELEDLDEFTKVEAKGFVYGTMKFENYIEVPLETLKEKRTNNKVIRRGIKLGDEIYYLDLKEVPYLEYHKEKIEKEGLGESFRPPFNFVKKVYYETEEIERCLTKEEAREKARRKLKAELFDQIPPNSKIIKKQYEDLGVEAGSLRKILKVEVKGNMGKLESFN